MLLKVCCIPLLLLILGGCASNDIVVNETFPGSITASTSEYDWLSEVRMKPAYVYNDSQSGEVSAVKVGARWSSRDGGYYVLVTEVESPYWFDKSEVLNLKVDGVVYSLAPENKNSVGMPMQNVLRMQNKYATTYSSNNVVRKEYVIDRSLLARLLLAKKILGRVNTTQGFVDFSGHSGNDYFGDPYARAQLFVIQLKHFLSQADSFNSQVSTSQ
jgi:hypothetical protein